MRCRQAIDSSSNERKRNMKARSKNKSKRIRSYCVIGVCAVAVAGVGVWQMSGGSLSPQNADATQGSALVEQVTEISLKDYEALTDNEKSNFVRITQYDACGNEKWAQIFKDRIQEIKKANYVNQGDTLTLESDNFKYPVFVSKDKNVFVTDSENYYFQDGSIDVTLESADLYDSITDAKKDLGTNHFDAEDISADHTSFTLKEGLWKKAYGQDPKTADYDFVVYKVKITNNSSKSVAKNGLRCTFTRPYDPSLSELDTTWHVSYLNVEGGRYVKSEDLDFTIAAGETVTMCVGYDVAVDQNAIDMVSYGIDYSYAMEGRDDTVERPVDCSLAGCYVKPMSHK